jgi:uncharacterized protein YjlB
LLLEMSSEEPTMPDAISPLLYRFEDDGRTPNNPRLPLILYRDVLHAPAGGDRAAICEDLFARHGWANGWRNGIHPFLHFHTRTHEVLGIARGTACVEFGGDGGQTLDVQAGDVVVLPAGTGHRRVASSGDGGRRLPDDRQLLRPGAAERDRSRPGPSQHRQGRPARAGPGLRQGRAAHRLWS